jgi:phenylacetate-CoA ligase
MLIAAECERHCGLHLTNEQLLVEIVDAEGRPVPDGEEGDVVVTDLYNYGMPFIRYRNGDRAIKGTESCGCGRGLPLLKDVTGRVADMIRTPDDRVITGLFFPHLMKDYPSVLRYQVVQEELDLVEMRVVATEAWNADVQSAIESAVRQKLGPLVRVELMRVADIPLSKGGKLRPVVSRCGNGAMRASHAARVPATH